MFQGARASRRKVALLLGVLLVLLLALIPLVLRSEGALTLGGSKRPLRILVIGDSYTGGTQEGGLGRNSWTSLLASNMNRDGYPTSVDVSAAGGSGYLTPGAYGQTFASLAERMRTSQYDIVVIFGSRNDTSVEDSLRLEAIRLYGLVHQMWPTSELVVVGPPWPRAGPPQYLLNDRDALAVAARASGGVFIDPVTDGWFASASRSLIGADEVHPTDAGHAYMELLIRPVVETAAQEQEHRYP